MYAVLQEVLTCSAYQVVLYSSYKLADKKRCWGEARGGLLHEMFHMFGVMHTQMRADRDKYINVYKNNVQRFYRREYDVRHHIFSV